MDAGCDCLDNDIGGGCVAAAVWLLTRIGLAAMISGGAVARLPQPFPVSFNLTLWSADPSILALMFGGVMALWGFWTGLPARPFMRADKF